MLIEISFVGEMLRREVLDVGAWPGGLEYDRGDQDLALGNNHAGTVAIFFAESPVVEPHRNADDTF